MPCSTCRPYTSSQLNTRFADLATSILMVTTRTHHVCQSKRLTNGVSVPAEETFQKQSSNQEEKREQNSINTLHTRFIERTVSCRLFSHEWALQKPIFHIKFLNHTIHEMNRLVAPHLHTSELTPTIVQHTIHLSDCLMAPLLHMSELSPHLPWPQP